MVKQFVFKSLLKLKFKGIPEGFRINLLTLKFEENLEKVFRKEYNDSILTHFRYSILLAILLYAIFGILDKYLIPEMIKPFLIIRFLIVIPFAIFCFIISYFNIARKIFVPLVSLLILIAGLGIVAMIYLSKDYQSSMVLTSYYTGLLLVFIYAYSFLKLRFWWATISCWLIVISYEVLVFFLIEMSPISIIVTNFFLISANIMGMFSSYFYDLTLRMNFYHKNLLSIEKKNIEAINEQLEYRVLERTKKLEEAKEEAVKSEKLKSMFLANISHEIRTPMNGILGFASLLNKTELSLEKRKSYLEIINERGEYLMGILNNLIEFAMIESNSMKVYQNEVKLNYTLNNLYKFLIGFFQGTELIFKTSVPENSEELIIRTDKVKLEQIITNLVTNASKYSSAGEVCLGYKIEKEKLRIFVSDNGPGIPEEFRQYIFKSFTKNEKDKAKFAQGTGLGLAISKGLAELMGADLSYSSTLGEGTTFYLDFDIGVMV
ncbi:MAG: hypothetical protein K9H49_15725 [Bacteroidales bacterium]|nr:hypothetical protein [Bacteroidales bacterium]MCF8391058.1 hypothetical protein [Bacteroidales bacterium]